MAHVSPELLAIVGAFAVIWFAVTRAAARIERAIYSLSDDVANIEAILSDARWRAATVDHDGE